MTPLRETVRKTPRGATPTTKQSNRLVGEYAIRTSAVRDDLDVGRQGAKFFRQAVARDRSGAAYVPSGKLGSRSNIDHDHITDSDPLRELTAAHFVELISFADVRGGEVIKLGMMGGGNVT